MAFELVVDFLGGFPDQEESAREQDQPLAADAELSGVLGGVGNCVSQQGMNRNGENLGGEPHHPGDGGQ
jgi:hypothetical protein